MQELRLRFLPAVGRQFQMPSVRPRQDHADNGGGIPRGKSHDHNFITRTQGACFVMSSDCHFIAGMPRRVCRWYALGHRRRMRTVS